MTHEQKSLVRYWLTGLSALVAFFSLSDTEHSRLFLLPALIVFAVIDKTMRPPSPEGTPSPKEIIENSRAWKTLVVLYGFAAVLLAILSIAIHDLGSWLGENTWVLYILVPLPIVGPVIQSQVEVYKAYGEN